MAPDSACKNILDEVRRLLDAQRLPAATYRLQFHAGMTFRNAASLVPYLADLGVSHLYASPIFAARAGSLHGYDVTDHSQVNPELGSLDDLRFLASELHAHGLGFIVDVVPNHMSAASDNAWWRDVQENGPSSRYAAYFDIDWMPLKPDLAYKVQLPVLGDQFGRALENGDLTVHFGDGEFWLQYFDSRFPLAPRSYALILEPRVYALREELRDHLPDFHELLSILTALRNLPPRTETDPARLEERRRETVIIKRRLCELASRVPAVASYIADEVQAINGRGGEARSFDRLDDLLKEQAYRLSYWRVAADEINYRRFFDINELAAICVEHPEVFDATHRLVFALVEEGLVDGLRIDHPDGLYDPRGYLWQLQERRFFQLCRAAACDASKSRPPRDFTESEWATLETRLRGMRMTECRLSDSTLARPMFVVVEKILSRGEEPPGDWPVHGTVGYEFLNAVNGVFVDSDAEEAASATYERFTGGSQPFDELAYFCKRLIVRLSMASELTVLGHRLDRISERNRLTRDFTLNSLTRALQEVVACFSVYRTYVTGTQVAERDRAVIEEAVARAKRRNPAMSETIFDFVRDVLLLEFPDNADEHEREAQRRFVGKFQQLTGPIMAKAVEDTAFYRFNRLISLNEVGGDPKRFGTSVQEFHEQNRVRLPRLAYGFSSTSTHDTKRSEDVRARINVLSEISQEWREHVIRWGRWNSHQKREVDGQLAPSRNLEYLLYQTLVGMWPHHASPVADASFVERIQIHLIKVAREAKTHSSWVNMHEPYERAITDFVERILRPNRRAPFLAELQSLARAVSDHGVWNSLSQTLLKIASPGVPDFYQGTETWSFTLVDPDNRQPVDFAERHAALKQAQTVMGAGERHREAFLADLVSRRGDGEIKTFVTTLALNARKIHPQLFAAGEYIPLETRGKHAERIIAFARQWGEEAAIVVAPRLTVGLVGFGGPPPAGAVWEDTSIALPTDLRSARFVNAVSNQVAEVEAGELQVSCLLRDFPLALGLRA